MSGCFLGVRLPVPDPCRAGGEPFHPPAHPGVRKLTEVNSGLRTKNWFGSVADTLLANAECRLLADTVAEVLSAPTELPNTSGVLSVAACIADPWREPPRRRPNSDIEAGWLSDPTAPASRVAMRRTQGGTGYRNSRRRVSETRSEEQATRASSWDYLFKSMYSVCTSVNDETGGDVSLPSPFTLVRVIHTVGCRIFLAVIRGSATNWPSSVSPRS